MRAIGIKGGSGAADSLFITEMPMPVPARHEIRIRVVAAGVNRPDIGQREGNYPPPPGASEILGLEVAGVVDAVGEDVRQWQAGDRVAALLPGGGYAEYATVDAEHALPVPTDLPLEDAGALPETVFTVFANLFEDGRLAAGETVLVHGGNSGIGVTAVQLAKAAGATAFVTVRGNAKKAAALAMGADLAIDTTIQDFASVVREAGGADIVLDMVGAAYFKQNIAVLRPRGRLVQIATLSGNLVEADLLDFMFRRLTLTGSTLRSRPAVEKARLTQAIREKIWPWIEQGKVRIPVSRKFRLDEAGMAHRWLEDGNQFGKVVLLP